MEKNQVILEKVLAKLEKSGKKFARPQGKLYTELKRIYFIIMLYLLMMNLFFLVSGVKACFDIEDKAPLIFSMLLVLICSAAIIVGYAFIKRGKCYLLSGIVSVLSSLALLLYQGGINTDNNGFLGFKDFYYWRFFMPLVIMIVLFAWLTVIAVRAKRKIDSAYKNYVDKLYNEYTEKNGTVTYSEWEEYLKNYTLETAKKTAKSGRKDAR